MTFSASSLVFRRLIRPVAPSLVLALGAGLFSPATRAEPVTPEQRALILAALPAEAPAKPARPRKLLVYTQTKGYRHASIETGAESLRLMGERTGAYTTTVTDQPEVFTAASLAGFDAVLFLSTTGEIFTLVESKAALLDFVRRGGGIVGIHAATDSCYHWPEWGSMMGGYFDSHPWTWDRTVTILNEEPGHPFNAPFARQPSFSIQDEIYQLKAPYSRTTHRVILSLDTRRSDFDDPAIAPKIKRTDGDFAISQLRTYEKGRVFYCSLGHNHAVYWNRAILGHYLAGIQWALGDLAADSTPQPKRPQPPLAQDPALFTAVAATGYADHGRAFGWLDTAVAEAGKDPALRDVLEGRLLDLLASPAATPAARQAAAEQLGRILPAALPAKHRALKLLGPWLTDPARVNVARLALEPVSGEAVDELFVKSLKGATGAARLALVQSIGNRRIASAVPALKALLANSDSALAAAAAKALGAIATPKAYAALTAKDTPATAAVWQARLDAARQQPAATVIALARDLTARTDLSVGQRNQAFLHLLAAQPDGGLTPLLEVLASGPSDLQEVALNRLRALEGAAVVARVSSGLSGWSAPVQSAVLAELGRRGDAGATEAVTKALAHPDESVRLAAIAALGELPGQPDSARRLLELALRPGAEGKAAALSLSRLSGPAVGTTLQTAAETGPAPRRAVAVRQLALRGTHEALPYLLSLRQDPEVEVRLAALESLDSLGRTEDQAAVLAWARAARDAGERNRAVRTLIAVTLRDPDVAGRTRPLIAALDDGTSADRLLLLPALPRVANPATLATTLRLARSTDAAVQASALTTLTRWPETEAARGLTDLADTPSLPADQRATAVDAATRLLERDPRGLAAVRFGLLERLLAQTESPEVKRRQLFLLSRARLESFALTAERYVSDSTVAAAAREAALSIRANLVWPPDLTASTAANQLKAATDGNVATAWSVPAREGQWLKIDFKQSRPLRRLTLERGSRTRDHPDTFDIHVSDDASNPGPVRFSGRGNRDSEVIELPAGLQGRYLMIKLTATRADSNWSVAEVVID